MPDLTYVATQEGWLYLAGIKDVYTCEIVGYAMGERMTKELTDGFEFRCDNGEKLRVTFALDCCDREPLYWAVTTGGFDSETVQDVMLGAVERRFGNELPASPVEWLTDNGSCYRANETRQFARHCCKVSDEAAFCLIQRPYISKTLLTRRISPRGSP